MMRLRDADVGDAGFLWEMLTHAASMSPGGEASVAEAQRDTNLRSYVDGWPLDGDLGVIAVDEAGERLGAAWVRPLRGEASPFKVATATEPEVVIGVTPGARGRGVGAQLLEALLRRASGRYTAVVLSVRATNPSVRLYERAGFVTVRHLVNRVGGDSLAMRRELV